MAFFIGLKIEKYFLSEPAVQTGFLINMPMPHCKALQEKPLLKYLKYTLENQYSW
ncbi:MAG: hypothetical protein ACKOU7_01370 [Ferruginibacter sp.]